MPLDLVPSLQNVQTPFPVSLQSPRGSGPQRRGCIVTTRRPVTHRWQGGGVLQILARQAWGGAGNLHLNKGPSDTEAAGPGATPEHHCSKTRQGPERNQAGDWSPSVAAGRGRAKMDREGQRVGRGWWSVLEMLGMPCCLVLQRPHRLILFDHIQTSPP